MNALIAWGGVLAQTVVLIPSIMILMLAGDSLPWYVNTPLVIFGYLSALIALVNLAPSPYFDGYYCWKILSYLLNRKKATDDRAQKNSKISYLKKSHLTRIK